MRQDSLQLLACQTLFNDKNTNLKTLTPWYYPWLIATGHINQRKITYASRILLSRNPFLLTEVEPLWAITLSCWQKWYKQPFGPKDDPVQDNSHVQNSALIWKVIYGTCRYSEQTRHKKNKRKFDCHIMHLIWKSNSKNVEKDCINTICFFSYKGLIFSSGDYV